MERDLKSQIKELQAKLPLSHQQLEELEKAYLDIGQTATTANVPGAGEEAPDFTLPNAVGVPVSLSAELAVGPAVVTFYRGIW